ncbi:transmembrane emp24 domain-containing protein p24delta9-like [Cynara cardunculus var. scolymus]|uniref:GOLD-like protein n=1 Tax=Cynara cardunculus var. scolymus TaxID=59895 RepID=A0A103YAK1_CYNCS|nr:transmembrane emp24 domain-containing protein p24delta9-like [Cynara cardunculus var. scolymus]KVI05546.1 GOLD-like protein [Cynara cardunculus var. scolymus]
MELQKFLLSILLLLGFLSIIAQSIRFEIESGYTKCIAEDIKSNSMTVGHYSVVNPSQGHPLPESHKITLRVTSVSGNSHHYADHVQSGQFAFQAIEGGDYMACFFAIDHHPRVKIPVEFDWRSGVAAKDWSTVAKKGSVDAMELELKKLTDAVTSIHEEMFYLREREQDMQQLNNKTNSRMALLSFVSLFVCLSVAGLQLWHLKSFFEKKKLI